MVIKFSHVWVIAFMLAVSFGASASGVEIVTNRPYRVNCGVVRSCTCNAHAWDTIITNVALDSAEIALIQNLADVYVRKIALAEWRMPKMSLDSRGRKFMIGHNSMDMFPLALPDEFEIFGLPYAKLSLTVVPYVVRNKNKEGCLKGGVCEYRLNGSFQFGLYVNLNTLNVAADFCEGSSCPMLVKTLGRFPFLDEVLDSQVKFSKYVDEFNLH